MQPCDLQPLVYMTSPPHLSNEEGTGSPCCVGAPVGAVGVDPGPCLAPPLHPPLSQPISGPHPREVLLASRKGRGPLPEEEHLECPGQSLGARAGEESGTPATALPCGFPGCLALKLLQCGLRGRAPFDSVQSPCLSWTSARIWPCCSPAGKCFRVQGPPETTFPAPLTQEL